MVKFECYTDPRLHVLPGTASPAGDGEEAAISAVALVLGSDDLLIEILVLLDSPTWLVRAAAVCRRWLRRVSDPAFLRRFRALHPPRILALCVGSRSLEQRFPALPQPQELAAAARRAARALCALSPSRGTHGLWTRFLDCRNGRLLVKIPEWPGDIYAVRSLVSQVPDIHLPALPAPKTFFAGRHTANIFLLEDDDADVTSCLRLDLSVDAPKVHADFFILQSGVWGAMQSAETELEMVSALALELQDLRCEKLVVGRKVYILTFGFILGLDLATNSFFTVNLPDNADRGNHTLSRSLQSGLYLISAMGFQLRIWHGDGAGQWVLVDTVSVHEACGRINVPRWESDDGCPPVCVVRAGDNAEFVFLRLWASRILCCMQLGKRIAERVDIGMTLDTGFIHPISMVWPPIFPTLGEANQERTLLHS